MKLILYNNFSELNKVDKTISKIIELEGSLLEATSLVNPVIKVFFNPEEFNGYVVEDNDQYIIFNGLKITWDSFIYDYVLSANYAYIQDFNRYYTIIDIVSYRKNLWYIHLHVDVLMSYKKQIKKLDAFVARNEFRYNSMIKDDLVSYYYDKEINEFIPEKGSMVNQTFSTSVNPLYTNIAVTVINEDIESPNESVLPPTSSLPEVFTTVTGDSMTSRTYATYPAMLVHLAEAILADDTKATYVLSVLIFPFVLGTYGQDHNLKLGTTTLENVSVSNLDKNISKYFVIADFTVTGDSFLDLEPYTQYEIFLPYLGWVTLSADNILNSRIIVYYVVNYITGGTQVNVYDVTHSKILYSSNAQLGVRLGLTATNSREVNDNRNSNNIGLSVGLLTSAVAIVAGAFTYNPIAIAGGVVSAGSTIAKYVQNQNTNYTKASGSISSGQSGLYTSQDVKLRITKLKPKNYNADYAKLVGRPLNEYCKLEELTGYTVVGDCHVENIASATSTEYSEIKSLLESGIIL